MGFASCCYHRQFPPTPLCPSLDASEGALAEDWVLATRLHIQRELILCLARRLGGGGAAGASTAIITSSSGRASVALHPSSDPAALLRALAELPAPSGGANLDSSLKLALVRAAKCRRWALSPSDCLPPDRTH